MARVPAILMLGLVPLALACGKRRVDERSERYLDLASRWDPPTAVNGFYPVAGPTCSPRSPSTELATTKEGTLEDLFTTHERPRSFGADSGHLYWSNESDGGSIWRTSRPGLHGPWVSERLAKDEQRARDIAVGNAYVYWVVAAANDAVRVRFYEKATGRTGTLETMTEWPLQLVAHGDHLLWIQPPYALREAVRDRPGRDVFALKVPYSTLLAVDSGAAYGFIAGTLLRIPRNGGVPSTLATSKTAPLDLVVDGEWVYWLEPGAQECDVTGQPACHVGYQMRSRLPDGSLHRVSIHGGSPELVARGLPDVDKMTFLHGSAWVSTRSGLLRLDLGVQPVKPVVVEVARRAGGRTVAIGDALLLMSATVPTTVSMLTDR